MLSPKKWAEIRAGRDPREDHTRLGNFAFAAVVIAGGVLCGVIGRWWGWPDNTSPAMVMLGAILIGGALRYALRSTAGRPERPSDKDTA